MTRKRTDEELGHYSRGEADAQEGRPAYYGCHVGMKSTRADCVNAYHEGYNAQLRKVAHLNVVAKFWVQKEVLSDGSKVWNVTCSDNDGLLDIVVAFPVSERDAVDLCARLNSVLRG